MPIPTNLKHSFNDGNSWVPEQTKWLKFRTGYGNKYKILKRNKYTASLPLTLTNERILSWWSRRRLTSRISHFSAPSVGAINLKITKWKDRYNLLKWSKKMKFYLCSKSQRIIKWEALNILKIPSPMKNLFILL